MDNNEGIDEAFLQALDEADDRTPEEVEQSIDAMLLETPESEEDFQGVDEQEPKDDPVVTPSCPSIPQPSLPQNTAVNPTPVVPIPATPIIQKPVVHPALRTGRFMITMKEGDTDVPFDPREQGDKGFHRNAYLKKDIDTETVVYSHEDWAGQPLSIGQHLRLNKDDKVRVSAGDVAVQAYARNNFQHTPNQAAPAFNVRFALRRGWFWFKGNIDLNDLFID